jgi:hypothetical protein
MGVTTRNGLNKYSGQLTQVRSQVGSQAMLYGVGLTDEDMLKPQVGIASMGWEGNTCNMHLNDLAKEVKDGRAGGGHGRVDFPHDRHQRRHLDGHTGDEGVAALARHHRRLDRGRDARTILRRQCRAAWLRQEHARHDHGGGAPQPPDNHRLWRHHPRRTFGRSEARHRLGFRGVWQVAGKGDQRGAAARGAAQCLSLARARVAACTPPTPCPPLSRRWA